MRTARFVLAAALLAAVLAAVPAFAYWPNDSGVNVRVAPSVGNQWMTHSAPDGAGGVFVAWTESPNAFVQHLDAQGTRVAGWPAAGLLLSTVPGVRYVSGVAADGAGGAIVAFDDYRNGATSDVYAQRVTASGALLWGAGGVPVCTAADYQYSAQVVSDRAGGALFVWSDQRAFAVTSTDLYAQHLDASGAPLYALNGIAVCNASGDQGNFTLIADGTVGGAYVAWDDGRTGGYQVYAQRLLSSGPAFGAWTTNGLLLGAFGSSYAPALASDGNFGMLAVWSDARTGTPQVYASHVLSSAALAAGWPANGLTFTSGGSGNYVQAAVPDGAGGCIVGWQASGALGYDVYVQRISGTGATQWGGGVALTAVAGDQQTPRLVSDGAGGAVAAWYDNRAGSTPLVYGTRVTGAGSIATGFAAGGNPIATAHWAQELALVSDGAGGGIATWQHNGSPQQVYAQRLDRWGYLGGAARIASVKDVPNDQGGRVKLSWLPSALDAYPANAIASYGIYRSVPAQVALAAIASGEAAVESADTAWLGGAAPATSRATRTSAAKRTYLATPSAGTTVYWEFLASVTASQLPGYSMLAPTTSDSLGASNPRTLFMVCANGALSGSSWVSDADSGYSVDNLAPVAPAPFTGTYSAGTTFLHWAPNPEPDVALYRLYRGSTAGFTPSDANLVATQPDTGYADPGAAGSYYKLVAVDLHGNAGPAALLTPSATLAVEGGATVELALAPAMPNPARGATTCRFALPVAGTARLAVYDAAGRLVRVLTDGALPAGEHVVLWDGTTDAGTRVPSGLYLTRLTFAGRTLTGKIARIE